MKLKEVKEFLNKKPGYLREGRTRLARVLNLDYKNEAVTDMLAQALREVRNETKANSGLELKSKWQNSGGVWLESYKASNENLAIDFAELKDNLYDDLRNLNPSSNYTGKNIKDQDENLLEISLPDFHLGKIDDNTIEEQCEIYLQSIKDLVNKASGYNITRIVLPTGNDLFNSDSIDYTTTKGTPQLDNATWQKTFRLGCRAVILSIQYLKQIAPVDVIIVQGNHDYQKSFYLGEILDAYYFNDNNVTINNELNAPRKYYKYGNTLLGYTHGNNEKMHDLPLLMAVEKSIEFANTKNHYWRLGHIHKEMINEYQGIVVEVLPALCSQDEWHKKMGYNSRRKARAYIWNIEYGQEGHVQINR